MTEPGGKQHKPGTDVCQVRLKVYNRVGAPQAPIIGAPPYVPKLLLRERMKQRRR